MKPALVLGALALTFSTACGGGGGQPGAATEKSAPSDVSTAAADCARCHKPDSLDLSAQPAAELLVKLKTIRDGSIEHPTSLKDLSDAQLEAIAKALGSK